MSGSSPSSSGGSSGASANSSPVSSTYQRRSPTPPHDDRPALAELDRHGVRQADPDLGPGDGRDLAQPRLQRLGGDLEQVRPPVEVEPVPDGVVVGDHRALDVEPFEAERRRRGEAVDRAGAQEHGEGRPGAHPCEAGRAAADQAAFAGPARRPFGRVGPSLLPRRRSSREVGWRERSPDPRGVSLEGERDDLLADVGEGVAAGCGHRREEADRGEAGDRVDLREVDVRAVQQEVDPGEALGADRPVRVAGDLEDRGFRRGVDLRRGRGLGQARACTSRRSRRTRCRPRSRPGRTARDGRGRCRSR